jgi:hypothetical protein
MFWNVSPYSPVEVLCCLHCNDRTIIPTINQQEAEILTMAAVRFSETSAEDKIRYKINLIVYDLRL